MSLLSLFRSLNEPDKGTFSAMRVSPFSMQRIARNDQGHPCILLTCRNDLTGQSNISLQHLKVDHRISCAVVEGNQLGYETFTVVAFKSGNPLLQEYFLKISESLIASLPNNPTERDVIEIIYRYIEVLRTLSEPPRKSVQGLWAELLIILESQDVATMLKWWHSKPEDRYDFNAGALMIEVKSSSSSERIHHFSLEQLSTKNHQVLVASVLMRSANTGLTVEDLRQRIGNRLNGDLLLMQKLDLVIARTLGCAIEDASEISFDYNWAKNSIQCYSTESIPKVGFDSVPMGVSEIRFKVDLSYAADQPHDLFFLQTTMRMIVQPDS